VLANLAPRASRDPKNIFDFRPLAALTLAALPAPEFRENAARVNLRHDL
jgi:hypothetical protein